MKAYGEKLWWIECHQYGENRHSGTAIPNSGHHRGERRKRYMRPFKKMTRQAVKRSITRYCD